MNVGIGELRPTILNAPFLFGSARQVVISSGFLPSAAIIRACLIAGALAFLHGHLDFRDDPFWLRSSWP